MRLLWVLCILWAGPASSDESAPLQGTVEVRRIDNALWRATYCFDEPIENFSFTRRIKGMRETHWRSASPGLALKYYSKGTATLLAENGSSFTCASIDIKPFTDLPDGKDYYVFTPFSDGGASLFTGHLEGLGYQNGSWRDVVFEATYQALDGERVIAAEPDELGYQFVYFGAQKVVETDEAILVIDPAMPERVRQSILATMSKTNELLPRVFGYAPKHKYLVFMAAGNLTKDNGTSIKGGTGPHQIRFTLVGRGTIRLAENEPLFYPKLAVHEVLHLWQNDVWSESLSTPHQWVHEGGADAVTYEIMRLAGIYDKETYAKTWQEVETKCVKLLAVTSVHGGVEAGQNDVLYQCGAFANYLVGAALNAADPGAGILDFWKSMAAWDRETIQLLENEELFFKTMVTLGFSVAQQQALQHFLADKLDDPATTVVEIKRIFGLPP